MIARVGTMLFGLAVTLATCGDGGGGGPTTVPSSTVAPTSTRQLYEPPSTRQLSTTSTSVACQP